MTGVQTCALPICIVHFVFVLILSNILIQLLEECPIYNYFIISIYLFGPFNYGYILIVTTQFIFVFLRYMFHYFYMFFLIFIFAYIIMYLVLNFIVWNNMNPNSEQYIYMYIAKEKIGIRFYLKKRKRKYIKK